MHYSTSLHRILFIPTFDRVSSSSGLLLSFFLSLTHFCFPPLYVWMYDMNGFGFSLCVVADWKLRSAHIADLAIQVQEMQKYTSNYTHKTAPSTISASVHICTATFCSNSFNFPLKLLFCVYLPTSASSFLFSQCAIFSFSQCSCSNEIY